MHELGAVFLVPEGEIQPVVATPGLHFALLVADLDSELHFLLLALTLVDRKIEPIPVLDND